MKSGFCGYCGKQAELVDSHIIPKGLYWELQGENHKSPKVLSPFEGEHEQRRPNGIYDNFLCPEHEEQFNDWDTYAVELLRDTAPKPTDSGWLFGNIDYGKIKLFFISLLWRAHATKNSFFERVNLGPHADRLKQLIEHKDPGSFQNYPIVLWRSEELIAKVIIAPYREKYEGISFIRFYLPGYMALIKVDQRPLPAMFKSNALIQNGYWFVSSKQYAEASEERIAFDVARNNLKKKSKKQHRTNA